MIEIDDLHKRYGSVVACGGMSFTARDAAITGVLGPNGSGKTTCLRSICGLIRPDAGAIRVDGHSVASDPTTVRKRIGVFPDEFGLYQRLTAREHLAYFGRLHDLSGHTLRRAVAETIELLGIEDIADRRTEGFSQGQRMKVALARAMLHRPQNLVLDEPTRGLDVMSTRALRETLRRIRAAGCCILFSSHVMQEVGALCDEVVVVSQGRTAAVGTPAALCAKAGERELEEAFIKIIGSGEGLAA